MRFQSGDPLGSGRRVIPHKPALCLCAIDLAIKVGFPIVIEHRQQTGPAAVIDTILEGVGSVVFFLPLNSGASGVEQDSMPEVTLEDPLCACASRESAPWISRQGM